MKISLRSPIPCTPFSISVGALPKAQRSSAAWFEKQCLEKRSLLTIASAIVSQSQSHGVARGFGTGGTAHSLRYSVRSICVPYSVESDEVCQ